MARSIGITVGFDWDFNGTFTDESANLVSANGDTRFAFPGKTDGGMIDQCTLEMRNVSGRYSPLNTSGALYAYVQAGGAYHVPVRVEAAIDGSTYTRIFTGVTKIPRETGRSVDAVPTVTFDCRGMDELILQRRISTTQSGFVGRYEDGFTEAQIINAFLTAGGVTGQQIDTGMITIPWSYMDDESVLEECWAIASAAGGRLYCDVNGVMRYENLAHWLFSPHLTSQQTYTAADWTAFRAVYDDTELYDSVTVEYAPRLAEVVTVLWEPDEIVTVPANTTRTVTATFSYPSYSVPTISWEAHTAGGTNMTASVTVTPVYYAQRAVLTIVNTHASLGVRINPLVISGRSVIGGPTVDVEKTAAADGTNDAFFVARATKRNKAVRGNYYIQSKGQADFLAQFMLDRFEKPALTYEVSGTPGIPARRPGDRVTLNDTSIMSSARAAMVIGMSWRYSGMSYTQELTCIDAAALYPYATTTPGYFVINTNKLGAADPLRGRVFY